MELTILLLTVLPISVFGLRIPKEHFFYRQGSSEGSEAKAGSMIEVGFLTNWLCRPSAVARLLRGFLAAYLFLELKKPLEFFFFDKTYLG